MNVVRFGLIGCGDIAQKRVAPAMRDSQLCELLAVSRAHAQFAESFANQFGAKRWYADWRELLLDEEINAVYIATPVHLHAEQVIAAAEGGKHVLCEKPMGLNVAECDRMIDACEHNHVTLGIAYYRHFYPVVRRVQEIIESGEIGTPVVAQVNAFEWFDPDPTHPRVWLLDKKQSGGGPIFGAVKEVQAITANSFFQRGVEDVATATLRFERGTVATLTVAHCAHEPQDTLDVFGSNGSLHCSVLNEGNLRVIVETGERTESHPPAVNLHQPLIEDFARAVLDDRPPIVNGEIGRTVALIEEKIATFI